MPSVFFVLSVVFLLVQHSEGQYKDFNEVSDWNAYIDDALVKVRSAIYDQGLDPYDAIDKTILGVHFTGVLSGMRSLHRYSNVTVTYFDDGNVEVHHEFRIFRLLAELSWTTTFSWLPNVAGSGSSRISEVVGKMRVHSNQTANRVVIDEFKLTEVGKIHTDLDIISLPIASSLVTHVTDSIANGLKGVVEVIITGQIRHIMQSVFDDLASIEPRQ